MIGAHVEYLSKAIDELGRSAGDAEELVASIRSIYPHEPAAILRRAIFYALTDPTRNDGEVMLRLHQAAFALASADVWVPFDPSAPPATTPEPHAADAENNNTRQRA